MEQGALALDVQSLWIEQVANACVPACQKACLPRKVHPPVVLKVIKPLTATLAGKAQKNPGLNLKGGGGVGRNEPGGFQQPRSSPGLVRFPGKGRNRGGRSQWFVSPEIANPSAWGDAGMPATQQWEPPRVQKLLKNLPHGRRRTVDGERSAELGAQEHHLGQRGPGGQLVQDEFGAGNGEIICDRCR